jgi:hypothetical protein
MKSSSYIKKKEKTKERTRHTPSSNIEEKPCLAGQGFLWLKCLGRPVLAYAYLFLCLYIYIYIYPAGNKVQTHS